MARLSDREQTVIPGETFLGLIKKYPDLPGGRESRHSMERYVPAMPRDGVFGDAIPSRDVAIRQPSNRPQFHGAWRAGTRCSSEACDQPSSRSQRQNAFRQTTH
jgi:hypothetical protein